MHILIVDDQRILREGLRTLLSLESDLAVAAEAEDGLAALDDGGLGHQICAKMSVSGQPACTVRWS